MSEAPIKKANGRVLQMHLDGMSASAIAKELGVSQQAVSQHLKRINAPRQAIAIMPTPAEVINKAIEAVAGNWIADKQARMGQLNLIYAKLWPALETAEMVPVARELRGILRQAAEEMGQLPKPGDINIHAGDGSKVLVVSPEPPLGLS